MVIPIPDSARTAALAMAQRLGIPYREGLVKNRYVGRTFIMPSDEERKRSLRHKLNAIAEEFRGKTVLLVDDSIVRGNTARQIVELARQAGAKRVLFASMAPPLVHPCVYGIDMSTRREFVARDRTHAEVAAEIGADAVIYQTLDDLVGAVTRRRPRIRRMCTACFSGDYPTGDITATMLLQIEDERIAQDALMLARLDSPARLLLPQHGLEPRLVRARAVLVGLGQARRSRRSSRCPGGGARRIVLRDDGRAVVAREPRSRGGAASAGR